MTIESLCQTVSAGRKDEAEIISRKLLEKGVKPLHAITALTEAMGGVGEKFSRLEIFLPEMMAAGEAMAASVNVFRDRMLDGELEGAGKGKILIGTVKGDLHEIGKNIVKLMMEANGFEVRDLGVDVDAFTFIKEAQAWKPDAIGMSSLMTTTMPYQKEMIDLLTDKGLRDRFKIIVGGAPTTPEWAEKIGADLYCPDAGSAPRKLAELLDR